MAGDLVQIQVPDDVHLGREGIVDVALGQVFALSGSARLALGALSHGVPLDAVTRDLARRTGAESATIHRDLRELIYQLNRAALVNLRLGPRAAIRQACRYLWLLVLTRRPPPLRRQRFPLRCNSPVRVHLDAARGVSTGLAPVWSGLFALGLAAALIDARAWWTVTLVLALFVSVVSHEAGHAVAVGRRGGGAYLCVTGLSVAAVHTRSHSGWLVHVAGPAVTAAWGVVILLWSLWFHSVALALASTPFIAQAATLTVLSSDGRLLLQGRTAKGDLS